LFSTYSDLSLVSIQTQSLTLRALRKRKPQETQALALASSQSWLSLLRPSIPIGWRLLLLREILYATQTIAFEWKPDIRKLNKRIFNDIVLNMISKHVNMLSVSKE